jgi:hypothetical protein
MDVPTHQDLNMLASAEDMPSLTPPQAPAKATRSKRD